MTERAGTTGPLTGITKTVVVDSGVIGGGFIITTDVSCPGAQVNDVPLLSPTADIQQGITVAWSRVSTANTLRVALLNVTTGAIDPNPITFNVNLRRSAP